MPLVRLLLTSAECVHNKQKDERFVHTLTVTEKNIHTHRQVCFRFELILLLLLSILLFGRYFCSISFAPSREANRRRTIAFCRQTE